jgi:integral membrane protein (TIGR01906 family)
MKNTLKTIGLALISLSMAFFLIMTAVRLLLTPVYAQVEYRMPYFPADSYGFTLADRLKFSRVSIDYLINDAGISYLADQRIDAQTPLYNERELSHMFDVKVLVQRMLLAWAILAGLYAVILVLAWRNKWLTDLGRAMSNGGKITIGLIILILVGVGVSFDWLFTEFHHLFFTGDSWLFLYSDSLIRLFPIPFWRDAFILMGAFTILGAVFMIWLGNRWSRS